MKLRNAWEKNAPDWVRWAREPGHDSYWRFHRERFLALLPEPGRLTVDVGCSEGRVTRDLRELGHKAVGVDSSETMLAAAREADPGGDYVLADAAALPFPDGHADLVVAFMSLMDVDDMPGSVGELARVVEPGGRLALAVVHPINSGADREHPEDSLLLTENYFDRRYYRDELERDGLRMTFESRHWTLEDYFGALREIPDPTHPLWSRYPLFLHLRATKTSQPRSRSVSAQG